MKRGFTLIELLVYMAIMGFIIIVAGRVFSDSTKMRVRSQNMIKNSEEIGRISSLIKEDISQMGVKAWGQNESGEYAIYNVGTDNPRIYWNTGSTPSDLSSYALKHNPRSATTPPTYYDSIAFRKAAFDEQGRFLGIREIAWYAKGDSLMRRCATIQNNKANGTDNELSVCPDNKASANEADPVLIAKNITNFHIIPSKPGIAGNNQDTLFGKDGEAFSLLSRNDGEYIQEIEIENLINTGNSTTVLGTDIAQNTDNSNPKKRNELYLVKGTTETNFTKCENLSFKKGETYAIEFKMPFPTDEEANNMQFVPNRDHLAMGLRNSSGGKIGNAPDDILFYPPQSESADTHHLEFSVKDDVSGACVAITVAYFPPSVIDTDKGVLIFQNFKIFRKSDGAFHFPQEGEGDYDTYGTVNVNEKMNTKAFELILEIENKGEKSGTYTIEEKGGVKRKKGMVITTPNNGIVPQ